jgi:hypothetical protein
MGWLRSNYRRKNDGDEDANTEEDDLRNFLDNTPM